MFQPGQRVHITEGAFAGMDGIVITPEEVARLTPEVGGAPTPNEEEVWIAIRIFGHAVPVGLAVEWVRAED